MTHTNTQQTAARACDSEGLHSDTISVDSRTEGPDINDPQDLMLTTTPTDPRVDTRLLARQLDNKHKAVMALIDRYADMFTMHGQLTFKKTVGKRKQGGGNAERYALLNEDQAYFLLSLSRNTDPVVALKSKLIKAFGNARRAADMRKTEYLPGYHELHDRIGALAAGSSNERWVHANTNKLLNKFAGIEAGQRVGAAQPQQALLIVGQLVAVNAVHGATSHIDGYQRMKANLLAVGAMTQLEGMAA